MNHFKALMLFVFFITGTIVFAQGGTVLVVPKKIAFGKDCNVRDKVRNECKLEEKTLKFIKQFNRGDYSDVVTEKPASGNYHVLSAEIVQVQGAGGGAWSGAKSMKVAGKLTDKNGKVLGNFEAGRYSGGGAFAGYKGTCSILGRCTKAIGKDIGIWLSSPAKDSKLGDH